MTKMRIDVDVEKVKQEVIDSVEKQLKEHLTKLANSSIDSDYTLGIMIKDYTQSWIKNNLKSIVLKELENVSIKDKVEKAVQKSVQDIVHNQLMQMKL